MDHMLDNAWQEQRQRLAGLAAWFDPGTVRYLEALRVDSGWRCLEVGWRSARAAGPSRRGSASVPGQIAESSRPIWIPAFSTR